MDNRYAKADAGKVVLGAGIFLDDGLQFADEKTSLLSYS